MVLMVVSKRLVVVIYYSVIKYFPLTLFLFWQEFAEFVPVLETRDYVMGGFCCNIKVAAAVFFPSIT